VRPAVRSLQAHSATKPIQSAYNGVPAFLSPRPSWPSPHQSLPWGLRANSISACSSERRLNPDDSGKASDRARGLRVRSSGWSAGGTARPRLYAARDVRSQSHGDRAIGGGRRESCAADQRRARCHSIPVVTLEPVRAQASLWPFRPRVPFASRHRLRQQQRVLTSIPIGVAGNAARSGTSPGERAGVPESIHGGRGDRSGA
jgi:hypothetical protein